jgi:hypothetical protein
MELNPDEITRLTVIDHRESEGTPKGIIFEDYLVDLDFVVQDEGKTLKIFVKDRYTDAL